MSAIRVGKNYCLLMCGQSCFLLWRQAQEDVCGVFLKRLHCGAGGHAGDDASGQKTFCKHRETIA